MKRITTAAQARALDAAFVAQLGLPSIVLMETASRALADAVRSILPEPGAPVVVVCGPGNNGGDGYGCARWLYGWGARVSTWSLAAESLGDAAIQRRACAQLGVPEVRGIQGAKVLVDAVLGTGLDRPVRGAAADALRALQGAGVPIVAADLPSGLHADTGAVLGVVAPATVTVAFGTLKPGLLAEPGADLVGRLRVADIGLGAVEGPAIGALIEVDDLRGRWPSRAAGDHKGRSGHLLILAGSPEQAGAAVLACRGALAAGVGLVTLGIPRGAAARLGALPPEVMVRFAGDERLDPVAVGALDRFSAILAGPGLGGGAPLAPATEDWLRALWRRHPGPVLFDADALPAAKGGGAGPRVLTPHPGEAGRSLGRSTAEVQADRFAAAAALGREAVAVLKGRNTLIAAPAAPIAAITAGHPVLATGGTGDVLAGLIGALLARGVEPRLSALLGTYVHGRTGEHLAAERVDGWCASDVAAALPRAIAEVTA